MGFTFKMEGFCWVHVVVVACVRRLCLSVCICVRKRESVCVRTQTQNSVKFTLNLVTKPRNPIQLGEIFSSV